MIPTNEYTVRVLRAFGKSHRNDLLRVPGWRGAWLIKHGFVEAIDAAQQTPRKRGRPPKVRQES